MSVVELKRCFECGATYPQEVLACANDGTPLCFDTVGRRWKIEGVIGRRTGGAIFAAFHLVSGQHAAIDVLPGSNAREATAFTHFTQQLQALQILDQNKTILRLIEEGTERDGSRFMVSELGELRPLQDLIDEWQRPEGVLMEPAEAALLIRPLLALLITAGRLGMAHSSLDATQIFVGSANDFANGLSNVATVKLHGLRSLGLGPALREAQAADLRGLGRVLYELCTGKLPPAADVLAKGLLPVGLAGPLGQVVLRAIGVPGHAPYATAEEMQRALSTAALGGRPPLTPASVPPVTALLGSSTDPPLAKYTSLPPAPSSPDKPRQNSISSANSLPPVRVTAQHSAIPAPLGSLISGPQRSGLTSELRQVSILDLMREIKEQQENTAREETLARSRFRPSLSNIKVMPLPRPGGPDAQALDAAPAEGPGPSLGSEPPALNPEAFEPTIVDAKVPPVSFEPDNLALKLAMDAVIAPNRTIASAAPAAHSLPSAPASGSAAIAFASAALEPGPASPAEPPSPLPSAVSSPRPAATQVAQVSATAVTPPESSVSPPGTSASSPSPTAPPAGPLAIALPAAVAPPSGTAGKTVAPAAAAPAPRELPGWIWLAVLGPLLAIIATLVFKLLTRK